MATPRGYSAWTGIGGHPAPEYAAIAGTFLGLEPIRYCSTANDISIRFNTLTQSTTYFPHPKSGDFKALFGKVQFVTVLFFDSLLEERVHMAIVG